MRLLLGAGSSAAGVALVEALVYAGLTPLTPIAWPGVGAIIAAAVAGIPALVSGAVVVTAYYFVNLAASTRFQDFFAHPATTVFWAFGLTLLGTLTALMRRRVDVQRSRMASTHRLEQALEGSGTAVWDTDLATGECVLSAAWSEMLGGPSRETRTTVSALTQLIHPDDFAATVKASVDVVKGLQPAYAQEHRVRTDDGRWIWILSRGRVVERDPRTGRALRMVGTNIEITSRKAAEERMQDLAQHDGLTGMATRALFYERMQRALLRAKRAGQGPALLFLDLDHFKRVNDSLGHAAGDALLREFAARLAGCVREVDTIGRFGGDEFVVLLEAVRDRDNALRVAEKIAAAMREPFEADGRQVTSTASIGVALHDRPESVDDWMKRADRALFEAKAAGRDTVRVAA